MARERMVEHHGHRLHVVEHPGAEPAIVLMHGFPDNLHLYDRVVPQLAGRRVVAFDFLGWGRSDKPPGYPHTATNQVGEVEAVMDGLALEQAVLVAHDASGPPAIDWAVAHPERVSGLVLLNTYYGWHPALRAPEAIALYSTPLVRTIARAIVRRNERLDEKLFAWQVGRFIRDEAARAELVPRLYADFRAARPAFWRLNDDLLGTVISRRLRSRRLRHFDRPVRIVFGDADPYLNRRVAWRLHRLLPTSDLHLLATARHYVQVDEPERVAELIASIGAR
jgi:haloalkane dehalogenase